MSTATLIKKELFVQGSLTTDIAEMIELLAVNVPGVKSCTVNVSNSNGIRPVIEVDKTILSDTKEVTYGSTYGSLPLPTKSRYKFLGWYTTSGVKVDSDTKVEITAIKTPAAKTEKTAEKVEKAEATEKKTTTAKKTTTTKKLQSKHT